MTTETQVVNRFVAELRKDPRKFSGYSSRALRHKIMAELTRDDLPGCGYFFIRIDPDRAYMGARLERRIRKKAAQPFRRKKRGPLRRRAAGKNEVTRRV